jgi:hypothetical protein
MLTAMQGVYRRGKIELFKAPANVRDETPVLVTFLEPVATDLRALGIDEIQAAALRARLGTFVADWESPEMDIYDNYDAVKVSLQTR